MISRTSYKWTAPAVHSSPIKSEFELVHKIKPISFNSDKSVKEYTEEDTFVEKKSKWLDYLKSFDIGSPSDQIMEHLTKGTPLITAHTLPHGDFTQDKLLKGAEVLRKMREAGITLEMLEQASKSVNEENSKVVKEVVKKEGVENVSD